MKTAYVYSDKYLSYQYTSGHPLKMERLELTYELSRALGLFDLPETRVIETEAASESEILRFHTKGYVELLKEANDGKIKRRFAGGLGSGDNPIFKGVWDWSLLHAGASLQCARLVSSGKVAIAFNIAGGLHHAMADRASGFCYVNDPVLAIYHFVDQGKRVMYVDIDAHHGDGVQWAFYEDPRVMTVSFHQDGMTLFPGTGSVTEIGKGEGLGTSINVPMLPGTDDQVFCEAFFRLVPRLMERFKPDVIVAQLGVDSFVNDPLASLELTTNGFCRVVEFLVREAPGLVALGGGGYNVMNVARAWTLAWALMNGVELPDSEVSFSTRLGEYKIKLRDAVRESAPKQRCADVVADHIAFIQKHVFPLLN